MEIIKRLYVYVFETGGVVLYAGKGSGRRIKQQEKRFGFAGRILEYFDTDDAAFEAEKRWIKELTPTENKCRSGGGGGRCKPKKKSKELIAAEREWRKFLKELEEAGSRRYVARFLCTKLNLANCEEWGVSKVDMNRLVEVANGPRV